MAEIRKLWKPFIVIFVLSFIFINWNDISWVFDFNAVSRYASDILQKSPDLEEFSQKEVFEYSEKNNILEIPKLQISAPVIFATTTDNHQLFKTLDFGVVHYPTSVLPGEDGQTVILGHSATENWPNIKYDHVFSHIVDLKSGDEIIIYNQNRKLTYKVIQTIYLERGEDIPENDLTNSSSFVILVSCWPPGKDIRRIGVMAELTAPGI